MGDHDLLAIDDQIVSFRCDIGSEFSVDGIISQKMRQDFRFCPGIDGDDIDIVIAETGPDQISAYPPETVDCHSNAHNIPPSIL